MLLVRRGHRRTGVRPRRRAVGQLHRSGSGARALVAAAVLRLHVGDDRPAAGHPAALVDCVRRGRTLVAGQPRQRPEPRAADPRAEQGRPDRVPRPAPRPAGRPMGLLDRRQRPDPHRAVRSGQPRRRPLRRPLRADDDLDRGERVPPPRRPRGRADGGRLLQAGHRRRAEPGAADGVRCRPLPARERRAAAVQGRAAARSGAVPRPQGQDRWTTTA